MLIGSLNTRSGRRRGAAGLAMAVALAVAGWSTLSIADAAARGRVYNARISDQAGGRAGTTFGAGTRVLYLNFDYDDMAAHAITATVLDASGNVLYMATRTLTGRGTEALPLNSNVVVDRLFDALDNDTTLLILAVDDAMANIADPVLRFQHIQTALSITNRMRSAAAALGGLPLAPDARSALDTVTDRLADARAEGLAAVAEPDLDQLLPHLQAMRQDGVDLIVHLREAREKSFIGGAPFPPSVDCQPYIVNVVVNGVLRQSLEFAIGDPGAVADIQLRPGRHVLYPGLHGMDATALFATLVDPACAPVRDGTPITFTVEPAAVAAVSPAKTTTTGGSVIGYVRAFGPGGGSIRVIAEAGGARAVIVLQLGMPPQSVRLSAAHQQLVAGQSTTISAHVSDARGRPVADGTAALFEVTPGGGGRVTPTGAVTDRGIASTVFTAGPEYGQATVTVEVAGVRASVTLTVVPPPPASPSATVPPAPTGTPIAPGGPTAEPPPTAAPNTERPDCPGALSGALCDATLVVHVYRDDTCDRRFDRAWDRDLVGIPVTIAFGNGHQETQPTAPGGVAYFLGLNLPPAEALDVSVALPDGSTLCYNSPGHLTLHEPDFRPSRYERVTFRTR